MDKIKLLPEVVANQIAAGEVVNRPASVVKEMVENAIDAGAGSITVSYRNGGRESLVISDDGEGMSPLDARLAFDKHATSKIDTIDDVYTLTTFGFRGEALASIAAVATVELVTRRQDEELGTHIVIEGSRFVSQNTIASPVGSTFTVSNLFFNVPARRRVLESSKYEHRHIAEEFRRVALCHPEVEFNLYGEDAPVYRLSASGLRQRIVGIAGKRSAGALLKVESATTIVKVVGYVGHPSTARQSNSDQYLFVNGRFFKSSYFHKAILEAYEKLIPAGAQPAYFLYLEVDTERIDVNIHPQKTEIRFEDGAAIWQILSASVREALAKTGAVAMMEFEGEPLDIPVRIYSDDRSRAYPMPPDAVNDDYNPFTQERDPLTSFSRARAEGAFGESLLEFADQNSGQADEQLFESRQMGDGGFSGHLLLAGNYVAAGQRGELVLVNIARAREAILYQRYLLMLGNNNSATQRLLFPEVMYLSGDDVELLREREEDFMAFGFEYSVHEDGALEVNGIPADFGIAEVRQLLYDMLDTLRDERSVDSDEIRRSHLAATLAREGAHRQGVFAEGEINAILETLADGGQYNYTPDGRKVTSRIGFDEIETRF